MSTTALRIELLIIGFQASIWFILLVIGFENAVDFYRSNIKIIENSEAVIVLIVLAWCYSFGAIVDGVTAAFEDPKSLFIKKKRTDSSFMRLKYPDAFKELVISDFELRLLRSTFFNLSIIGISMWILTGASVLNAFVLAGALLVGIAWIRRLNKSKLRRASLYVTARTLHSKRIVPAKTGGNCGR